MIQLLILHTSSKYMVSYILLRSNCHLLRDAIYPATFSYGVIIFTTILLIITINFTNLCLHKIKKNRRI